MKRRLPTFASIRAFEASARLASMRVASEELLISSSAVSHQVRALEILVGATLFIRAPGRLDLTEIGQAYYDELSRSLDIIETATCRASQSGNSNALTISMQSSLLELWFVPLLKEFSAAHPEIQMSVVSDASGTDFATGIADVSIIYDQITKENEATFLFKEAIEPVCSEQYLKCNGPIRSPEDFTRHPLIWCDTEPEEWQAWLSENGVENTLAERWISFDTRAAALQVAREGLGIAMGRSPFVQMALERRHLVAPTKRPLKTGFGYRIWAPSRSEHLPKVKLFSQWLTRKSQKTDWSGAS